MQTVSNNPFRVMLVGEDRLVCDGLRALIEANGISVCAHADGGSNAIRLAAAEKPSLIVQDVDLNTINEGLELLANLRDAAPSTRVLLLLTNQDRDAYQRAIRSGALGVVCRRERGEVLIRAINKIKDGEAWIDRASLGNVLSEMTRQRREPDAAADNIKSLTDRENQVIALIAEGLKNKQIAKRLGISETTVTHHLSSIFTKLGVSDRLELVIFAFGHKLARLPK